MKKPKIKTGFIGLRIKQSKKDMLFERAKQAGVSLSNYIDSFLTSNILQQA